MYTLYTDQSELFEARISVSGASLTDTACRLMVETDQLNLMFTGKVDADGCCQIPIRALAKYLPEGTTGNMKLEVIAEHTYFIPWESSFTVKTNRKVTAEVKSKPTIAPIIEAKATVKKIPSHAENVSKIIRKSYSLKEGKLEHLLSEVGTYIKAHHIKEIEFEPILNEAFQILTDSRKK